MGADGNSNHHVASPLLTFDLLGGSDAAKDRSRFCSSKRVSCKPCRDHIKYGSRNFQD